nr:hypothetical protein [Streptomyces tricolor]
MQQPAVLVGDDGQRGVGERVAGHHLARGLVAQRPERRGVHRGPHGVQREAADGAQPLLHPLHAVLGEGDHVEAVVDVAGDLVPLPRRVEVGEDGVEPVARGADEGQGDDVPVLLGEVLLQAAGDLGGQPDRVGQLQGAGVGEGGLLAEAGPGDDAGFHAEVVPGPVGAGQAVDEEGDLGGLGVVARGGPEGVHERVAERLVGDGDQVPGGGVGHHEPAHLGERDGSHAGEDERGVVCHGGIPASFHGRVDVTGP